MIEILDKVKNDEKKFLSISSMISAIFWEGLDIPTELLEEMQRIV